MSELNPTIIPYTYNSILNRHLGIILLFFLIWPFGAFLYALYHFDQKESKVILVLFTGLFGYSMIAEFQSLDLYRVMQLLPAASHLSLGEFTNRIKNIYTASDSESIDLYRDTVTFIVSRFTKNGNWLMLVFGLIAGFAYIKVLSLFTFESIDNNINKYLLVIPFSFIIGIDQLAGVRFSLAAYIFLYGAIKVVVNGDNRYLLVAASSMLVHFSFFAVVLLLIIFLKLKYYPRIIYILLSLSFVLPNLIHSYIIQYAGFLGQAVEARTEMYNSLATDLNYGSDTSWYIRYRIILMLAFCYITLGVTRLKKKKLNYSDKANSLFFFSLIILSFVNFTLDIPHFGYRFQFVFLMFAFFYLYKIYAENSESILVSRLLFMSLPFSSLMVAYGLRSTFFYTPLSLYFFNLPEMFIYKPMHSAWIDLFN
jgi:hypothetical protein